MRTGAQALPGEEGEQLDLNPGSAAIFLVTVGKSGHLFEPVSLFVSSRESCLTHLGSLW